MLDDELTESPLEGDFFYNPRADLVAQRERIEHTYWEMIMVMSVDEIKDEIVRVSTEHNAKIADFEEKHTAAMDIAKAHTKDINAAKRAKASALRKLKLALGAAVLDEAD